MTAEVYVEIDSESLILPDTYDGEEQAQRKAIDFDS
jgi:hypothetical protein